MKKHVPLNVDQNRIRRGEYASDSSDGLMGAFRIIAPTGEVLLILSAGTRDTEHGWEHVSVSCQKRTPTWGEMCFVKDLFWDEHEMVVQYHPPKSEYVNHHPHCLHLWKHMTMPIPMPPVLLVGPVKQAVKLVVDNE